MMGAPGKSRLLKSLVTTGILILMSGICWGVDYDVTTRTLLEDMVDLRGLAEFGDSFYKSIQF